MCWLTRFSLTRVSLTFRIFAQTALQVHLDHLDSLDFQGTKDNQGLQEKMDKTATK